MKKLILSLIVLLLLISCKQSLNSKSNTNNLFIIKDIRGNQWITKEYDDLRATNEIRFIDIDGTQVVIHGNYSIIKYKEL